MWGLSLAEASGPQLEVWPDNSEAVGLFIQLSTQWRSGPNGLIGLDYNILPADLRPGADVTAERRDLFEAIRTMEHAALQQMRSK